MPSPARRANGTGSVAGATAANCTLTKPGGVTNGDIMYASMYIEVVSAVTAPSGWALVPGTNPVVNSAGATTFRSYTWWKRASSEGVSWTWTHASAFRSMMITVYSGAVASGNPNDPSAQSTNTGNNTQPMDAPAISPTNANTMLVAVYIQLNGFAITVDPSGMTQVVSAGTGNWIYDGAQAASGSTGNKDATTTADWWAANLIACDSVQASTNSFEEEGCSIITRYLW